MKTNFINFIKDEKTNFAEFVFEYTGTRISNHKPAVEFDEIEKLPQYIERKIQWVRELFI